MGEEYRMKNGKTQYEIFQHGSLGTKDNTGFIDYPFAQFYGKRLVLLGKQEWDKLSIGKKLTIDYAIIGKMFNGRIEDILELFSVRQFIMGPMFTPDEPLNYKTTVSKIVFPATIFAHKELGYTPSIHKKACTRNRTGLYLPFIRMASYSAFFFVAFLVLDFSSFSFTESSVAAVFSTSASF